MLNEAEISALGGLLHDIGKVVYRAGQTAENHSRAGGDFLKDILKGENVAQILNCVRFHHGSMLRHAKLPEDSPAYIVYAADNIAAGADRRDRESCLIEGEPSQPFRRDIPLSSVFNLMFGGNLNFNYAPSNLDVCANYPSNSKRSLTADIYSAKTAELKSELSKIPLENEYINSLMTVLENILLYVPSSTCTNEVADISLYDHSKITAAAAAAITLYMNSQNRRNYRQELFDNEASFVKEKAFLMFSCDFSGIQKFIYTIASKGALKSLRSRSFMLEMLMEYFMDELLCQCGLSRANLIYTGGGHAYVLLPNTKTVLKNIEMFEQQVNGWLVEQFQTSLYLACSWQECSADDLCNRPAEATPYVKIYHELSRKLAEKKSHRYSAEELRRLNRQSEGHGERECKICGVSERLAHDEDICSWCSLFSKISSQILRPDIFPIVLNHCHSDYSLPIPNIRSLEESWLSFVTLAEAQSLLANGSAVRVYSKNKAHTGLNYCTNLYVGDYVQNKFIEDLAEDAEGIKRIAVLRADVDNLGTAFVSGFEREGSSAADRSKYTTLSRSAAFSKNMSMFFKCYINSILSRKDKKIDYFSLCNEDESDGKKLLIVYSGGDDIFIVGAWNDVLEAAVDIHEAFDKFTCGRLTLSAGIMLCGARYPIYKAAETASKLESASKNYPGKDAVTLFCDNGEHTYKWHELSCGVIEKFKTLDSYLKTEEEERGKAFLYKLLDLLRAADKKINIARCAYLLARLKPSDSDCRSEVYSIFSGNVFSWINDKIQRKELITAIYIYVYLTRERS